MVKEINGEIKIGFCNDKYGQIYINSLLPESTESFRHRAKTKLSLSNKKLKILIFAKDISAFRASINSYLNWIKIIDGIVEIIK